MKEVNKTNQIIKQMQNDPLWTTKKVFGTSLWSKEKEILQAIWQYKKVTVRGCHGWGKTYTAAAAILNFLYSFPYSIVLSTAPTWRQVEKLVWKEVRAIHSKALIPLGGNLTPKSPELQIIQDQWYAAGLSTNDKDKFQGFHEKDMLIVVDEAAGIEEEIFEAIDGILTSENAHLLLIGNPTSIGGTFYNSHREKGWKKIKVSAFDTPNFKQFGITEENIANGSWEIYKNKKLIAPKMITPEWVADKYRKWGPNSPLYIARVKGNFPKDTVDTLIPIAWIEAAMERWRDTPEGLPVEIGVDVAEFGDDKTVIAVRKGLKCMPLDVYSKLPVMETAGKVIFKHREQNSKLIKVDVIGIGTGVEGRIAEQKFPTLRVNVSEAASTDEFINKRAELWWNLRKMLDPDKSNNPNPIALPDDEELMYELSSTKYKINSKGKIQIEEKSEMKKRLNRSPDRADAVVICFAPKNIFSEYTPVVALDGLEKNSTWRSPNG